MAKQRLLQPNPRRSPVAEKIGCRKIAARKKGGKQAPIAAVPSAPAEQNQADEEARSSPLVRKIAREHGVSLGQITGSGLGGRITKQDILSFIEGQSSAPATTPSAAAASTTSAPARPAPAPTPAPAAYPGDLVPMSNMRKIIAQRMIESRRTSAHVHCMYEVDFTRIVHLRAKHKNGFEQQHGVRLNFMPFFLRAAIIALQQWPIVNAFLEGDNIRYHRQI